MSFCDYVRDVPLIGWLFCSEPEAPVTVDPDCKPGCHKVAKDSEAYTSSYCGIMDKATSDVGDRCINRHMIKDMYLCECDPDVELLSVCQRDQYSSLGENPIFSTCCAQKGESCFTD
jgi:hypothetical protein